MKSKKKLRILLTITIVIIGVIIWWTIPSRLVNINPSEVSKIDIFDGNTGRNITITNTDSIEHIINNLNNITFKKVKISLGYVGYSFRTTIYKTNGKVYKKFIINSSNTIRKDPFFYLDESSSIDYDFIQDLIKKNNK